MAGLTASEVVAALGLAPLPGEGGYYRETWRSALEVSLEGRRRAVGTAIHYLLTPETYSALHLLASDEVYHFYRGDPVDLTLLHPGGRLEVVRLGPRFEVGERPQFLVPAGVWQGSRLVEGGAWALMGTTVSPGFDFADFRLADESLVEEFPQHVEAVRSLLAG